MFSPRSLIALALIVRSLIHFEWVLFLGGVIGVQNHLLQDNAFFRAKVKNQRILAPEKALPIYEWKNWGRNKIISQDDTTDYRRWQTKNQILFPNLYSRQLRRRLSTQRSHPGFGSAPHRRAPSPVPALAPPPSRPQGRALAALTLWNLGKRARHVGERKNPTNLWRIMHCQQLVLKPGLQIRSSAVPDRVFSSALGRGRALARLCVRPGAGREACPRARPRLAAGSSAGFGGSFRSCAGAGSCGPWWPSRDE